MAAAGKLTAEQIADILVRAANSVPLAVLAREYGVAWEAIRYHVSGGAAKRAANAWPPEKVEALRALIAHAPPLTASEMAARLGVTRNAVLGKCYRLKLPICGGPVPRPRISRRTDKPKPPTLTMISLTKASPLKTKPPAILPSVPEPKPLLVEDGDMWARDLSDTVQAVMALTARTCRWPIGDPKEPGFRFCMVEKPADGRPYCEEHHALAWRRA
jgi:GcrA cell cycle regulator